MSAIYVKNVSLIKSEKNLVLGIADYQTEN